MTNRMTRKVSACRDLDYPVIRSAGRVARMSPIDIEAAAQAVAEAIRAERAAARLSQAEVAARAEMPKVSYIRYESGARRPTLPQVIQIADALGIPLSVLVRRIEDRLAVPPPDPVLPTPADGYRLAARRGSSRGAALRARLEEVGEEAQGDGGQEPA